MQPGTLIITVPAQVDLRNIWAHIAQDTPEAADRMVDRILERSQLLADMPDLGRARPELGDSVRSLVAEPYLIVYRPRTKGAAVLRVLHCAQDIRPLTEDDLLEAVNDSIHDMSSERSKEREEPPSTASE